MALCTVTVNDTTPTMEKRGSETTHIERALLLAGQAIDAGRGTVTSGNIIGDFGVVIGSWTYSPKASNP
ncbi:hypothetical protein RAD16_05165 [Bradyrhizobium sp. 18BD]